MSQINFDDIFNELKDSVVALAKTSFKSLADEAASDGETLLNNIKVKLERWTQLLASGQLTPEDFELLVVNQKDLTAMAALREAGLGIIKAEQFRDSVINLVVDTVSHLVTV